MVKKKQIFGKAIGLSCAPSSLCIVMAGLGFRSPLKNSRKPLYISLVLQHTNHIESQRTTLLELQRGLYFLLWLNFLGPVVSCVNKTGVGKK